MEISDSEMMTFICEEYLNMLIFGNQLQQNNIGFYA